MKIDRDFIEAIRPRAVLLIETENRKFYANIEESPSGRAFKERLNSDPLRVRMSDGGGSERAAALPWDLPRGDGTDAIIAGDIVLGDGRIAIYYGEEEKRGVRLARIGNTTDEELLAALGVGDAAVTFSREWGE